nr:ATPase, F1/V1/A1 complex, alpha/beta subunit, zinc knuckle CX2CX4HX4C [Tanacetum cinerariifolium]
GHTFNRIASKWGKLMEVDDYDDTNFHTKRLCILTNVYQNILESFKIVFRGKVYCMRAKEVHGLTSKFTEEEEEDDVSVEDNHGGIHNKNIREHKINEEESSLKYPPGIHPGRDFKRGAFRWGLCKEGSTDESIRGSTNESRCYGCTLEVQRMSRDAMVFSDNRINLRVAVNYTMHVQNQSLRNILDVDFFIERDPTSSIDEFSWSSICRTFNTSRLFLRTFNTSKLFFRTFNTSKLFSMIFKKCRVLKLQALAWKDKIDESTILNDPIVQSVDINTKSTFYARVAGASAKDQPKVNSNFRTLVADPIFDGVNISISRKVVKKVFEEDDISLIAMFISKPVMIDSYTSSMCNASWSRSSFAWCLIELNSEADLVNAVTISIPSLSVDGFTKETIHKKRKGKSKSTIGGQFAGPSVKENVKYEPKTTTSAPKKGVTNVGNISQSSSMLKTTGNSSKKDNISMSNFFSAFHDEEGDDEEDVENAYDKSANLIQNIKAGESSSFTAVVG